MQIIVIGAGVIGSAIARELARYDVEILLIEKEPDVADGTSKANSGIIHAGYNADFDTLKGVMNVKSNPSFDKLCEDLKVPFDRNGSLVVGFDDDDLKKLKEKKANGIKNGIEGLKIIEREEILEKEPNINKEAKYALYAPTAGIISPYELTIGYADNAVRNGAEVLLDTQVTDLIIEDDEVKGVLTNRGEFRADLVINAAGLYSDRIAKMAGDQFEIHPRKGEYHLFDKVHGDIVNHTLFPMPTETSKGILVLPTVHGNLLIGPNANVIDDKDDFSTTSDGLEEVFKGAKKLVPSLPESGVITSFSGLRAALPSEDFHIGFSENKKALINLIGIQSPGLSSAPAIADKVVEMAEQFSKNNNIEFNKKDDFKEANPRYPHYHHYEENDKVEEWQEIVKQDEKYGEIICRCEHVSRGEIIDAINRPVPARTVDAIKRRTRASSGRCQAGFCGPRILDILSNHLKIDPLEVTKKGKGSKILKAKSKEIILKNLEEDSKVGDQ
ncbi:MAG TPA: NAD(P)/FAD-dependent oxidoreductase [Halanaerobiales bacterium]|nr:NAD(P)/FAD-dependent oxidoreductase [Halanaerobiales bacterium]